ncbi:universal stress protein [Streptomyces coeruleoprunus]|uniref:Universal stress protein n=1 Tax=Streptomyces coeruleoprunus TaxID=285563 RepID=A0ABV9XAD4_9ACTN
MSGTHIVTAGLDGSPESLAAAAWAADEAALRGARLRLVHVREWPVAPEIPAVYSEIQVQRSETLLRDVAARARQLHPDLLVGSEGVVGRAASVLIAETEGEQAVDLLVLGSRGLSGLVGFLAGSVGTAVTGSARRPVVLVRALRDEAPAGGARREEGRGATAEAEAGAGPEAATAAGAEGGTEGGAEGGVVLGVDIFQPCDELLDFAFAEARLRGCALRVVHCWSLPATYGYAAVIDPDIRTEIGRHVSANLSAMLLPWRQRHPEVPVVERAVLGAPGAHLVYAAAGADLLVIGRRRGRVPLAPHLGHVAHAVIHHAAAPVAVVPHE